MCEWSKGSLVGSDMTGTHVIGLPCRSWNCSDCGPRRQNQLRGLAIEGNPETFLTLTTNPAAFENPQQAHDELKHWLIEFVKWARAKYVKQRIEYLGVIEATKKGWPHFHVLMRAPFIPKPAIEDFFHKHMRSPICDIQKVHGQRGAARYVSKYLSKQPGQFGSGKRYVRSQRWVEPETAEDKQARLERQHWQYHDAPPFVVVENLAAYGHHFVQLDANGDRWFCARGPAP